MEPRSASLKVTVSSRSPVSIAISWTGPTRLEVIAADGKSFIRIEDSGTYVDLTSDSVKLIPSVGPSQRKAVGSARGPVWKKLTGERHVVFAEPRAEWRYASASKDLTSLRSKTTVYRWTVPLVVDNSPGAIKGVVYWVPAPLDPLLILVLIAFVVLSGWLFFGDVRATQLVRMTTGWLTIPITISALAAAAASGWLAVLVLAVAAGVVGVTTFWLDATLPQRAVALILWTGLAIVVPSGQARTITLSLTGISLFATAWTALSSSPLGKRVDASRSEGLPGS
ncbi:MAG: hypothetical protein ABR507_02750 [Actinomycetota bacterium]